MIQFDRTRSALTVNEWRQVSREYGTLSWKTAAKKHALRHGGAMVMLADDTMVMFTRRSSTIPGYAPIQEHKVSQKTYKPGTWTWATPDEGS